MGLGRNRLSAKTVEHSRLRGVDKEKFLEDGSGLRLRLRKGASERLADGRERHRVLKTWILRIGVNGARREFGLGSYPDVGLQDARTKADEVRRRIKAGDPPVAGKSATFRQSFEQYFAIKAPTLSNFKHRDQWRSTMEAHAFPKLGHRPVADIRAGEIIEVLAPIWNETPETAHRVLQRMKAVFEWAILNEQRERADPTIGVAKKLGTKHRRIEHFRAMPHADVPAFMARLREMRPTASRLALQFLILTACRSGEARLATQDEIVDSEWVIKAERMKAKRPHIVPLAPPALEVLKLARQLSPISELIFPGERQGQPLSDMTLTKVLRDMRVDDVATVHGFRSAFKDWCAEVAKVRDEVSEAALAHVIPNKVRAAYLRSTFLSERCELMTSWGAYCSP